MFERFLNKNKVSTATPSIRDTLFGDMPIAHWPSNDTAQGPFATFINARRALADNKADEAIDDWLSITTTPGLESRHYLQAWHFLRQHGQQPPAEVAKDVFGVIVEVGMPEGMDILAAYADLSARYLNHAGGGVIWDHPDDSLDLKITALLDHAERITQKIGPWDKERPAPVGRDMLRLSMLTPSGLHFGQGPIAVLSSDPFSAPMFAAATQLLQALTEKRPPK